MIEKLPLEAHFIINKIFKASFRSWLISQPFYKQSELFNVRLDISFQITFVIYLISFHFNYQISREKFEPEPGFKLRTPGFLARRSTT